MAGKVTQAHNLCQVQACRPRLIIFRMENSISDME